jgi:regulator of protease activity HflC (stomatin/prohibitin superfamily)
MRPTLATIAFITLPACATIPAGRAGVVLRPNGVDSKPLEEGVHLIGPLADVETYDQRAQEKNEDLDALSADGAMLEAQASVLTFHPAPTELVALAREVGPEYYQVLIMPEVRSALRRVLAAYRADQLDTPAIGRVEREVTETTARRLRPHHIVFDAISLRALRIAPSSGSYRAILETGVKEQEALASLQLPDIARQEAEERRAEARGVAEAHALIEPTISAEILTDAANRAWTRLLTAASTNVEVRPSAQPYVTEVEP